MTSKITTAMAQTQFDEIMDRALEHNDRFVVERGEDSAVLILSLADYYRITGPPTPAWLVEIQEEAKSKGLDKVSMEEIDAEIAASRRERKQQSSE